MLLKTTEGRDALQEPHIPDSPYEKSHPFIAVHPRGHREVFTPQDRLACKSYHAIELDHKITKAATMHFVAQETGGPW